MSTAFVVVMVDEEGVVGRYENIDDLVSGAVEADYDD